MSVSRFIGALFLAFAFSAPLQAQTLAALELGDLVRVLPSVGERTSGRLLYFDDAGLRIERLNRAPLELAFSDVRRLELGLEARPLDGARVGAGIGLIGGVVVGALISALDMGGGPGANLAVIGLPLITTPAGALIGALAPPRRFIEIDLPDR